MYQKFYIKQMKLELEALQAIYVQKITFGYVGWLAIEDVNFCDYIRGLGIE
jgi:hypothetical protein